MKVNQGGTTVTGKVTHAVLGEWKYDGTNVPWCSISINLSGVETHTNSGVEVTCKNCIRVTPAYGKELRNLAFEVTQLYRHGFDSGLNWRIKAKALFDGVSGVVGMRAIDVAHIVLSGNKEI